MTIITQNREVLYIQPEGPSTGLEPLSLDRHGMDEAADNTIPGRGVLFGRDAFGRATPKVTFEEPPSGLVTATISFDKQEELDFLEEKLRDRGRFVMYKFFIPAGRMDNYANWTLDGRLDVITDCQVSGGSLGAGPSKDFSGQPTVNTIQLTGAKLVTLRPPQIVAQTTTEGEDINSIIGISDLDPDYQLPGYPGPDKMLFAACDAASGVTPNILYTVDGGSTWTAFGADPFGTDEHASHITVRLTKPDEYRVIVSRITADASNPPEIAYADIQIGDESSSPTWNAVDIGSTNNDIVEAILWALYNRLYIGAGGDIFVSTDQGESFSSLYSGSNAINGMFIDGDDHVWAVGASNTILREKSGNRGTFEALVGPSGGGDFHSVAVGEDGTIYAGNGTSIYMNDNNAANAGGWTSLKDFGSNHQVIDIQVIEGESQLLRAVVNDTSGNEGDIWYSLDGGNSWTEVSNLTNSGYNKAWFSETDPKVAWVVGEDDGSTGIIHKLATV